MGEGLVMLHMLLGVSQIVVGSAKWLDNEMTSFDCMVVLEGENEQVPFTARNNTGESHVQTVWDAVTGGQCGEIASCDDRAERLDVAQGIQEMDPTFVYVDANYGEEGYQSFESLLEKYRELKASQQS